VFSGGDISLTSGLNYGIVVNLDQDADPWDGDFDGTNYVQFGYTNELNDTGGIQPRRQRWDVDAAPNYPEAAGDNGDDFLIKIWTRSS